jgi:hypothetical protein
MFRESFPQSNNSEEFPRTAAPENPEAIGASVEHQEFGWNDIIVADDDQEATEKVIDELGFSCKNKALSGKQYADPSKTSWLAGEVLLSITYPDDHRPVDRETLRRVMNACKESSKGHIAVRVARLAPGEHFE